MAHATIYFVLGKKPQNFPSSLMEVYTAQLKLCFLLDESDYITQLQFQYSLSILLEIPVD